MWRVIPAALALASCYTEPDFGETRFRCDSEHACPSGQQCISGRCAGTPSVDGATGQLGVACGGTQCTAGMVCCADFVSGPRCIQAGTTCTGFAASCDGIEDCGGSVCCSEGTTVACRTSTCTRAACVDDADCTDPSAGSCCFGVTPNVPWGDCLATCL